MATEQENKLMKAHFEKAETALFDLQRAVEHEYLPLDSWRRIYRLRILLADEQKAISNSERA